MDCEQEDCDTSYCEQHMIGDDICYICQDIFWCDNCIKEGNGFYCISCGVYINEHRCDDVVFLH